MANGHGSLGDVWNAINTCVQAINNLTKTLTGAILTGPQGTTGPAGSTGPAGTPPPLRSYLAGLTLSNDGGSPNTVLDIAAGVATDSTAAVSMTLGAFTKSISGSWVSGTGNNGMGQGLTVAASTWYHVMLANNGGTPDVYFDTSVTGANRPSGITDVKVRRIGSFLTDASVHILAFTQTEDTFWWGTVLRDQNTTTLSTTAVLFALRTPLGVKTRPIVRAMAPSTATTVILLTSPDETDVATGTAYNVAPGYDLNGGIGQINDTDFLYTDTSSQIRARATGASTSMSLYTRGYIDVRGKGA